MDSSSGSGVKDSSSGSGVKDSSSGSGVKDSSSGGGVKDRIHLDSPSQSCSTAGSRALT